MGIKKIPKTENDQYILSMYFPTDCNVEYSWITSYPASKLFLKMGFSIAPNSPRVGADGSMAKRFCLQLAASSQPLQEPPNACDILGVGAEGSEKWEECGSILISFF